VALLANIIICCRGLPVTNVVENKAL
jgi:hypothetical protein